MSRQIDTYTKLKRQIHEDLRSQHPDWIESTGECPECDEYEARLRELLDTLTPTASDKSRDPTGFTAEKSAMRFLKESLLSFFVVGVVLSLYFVAAGAAFFGLSGFVPHRDKPTAVHHLKSQQT